MANLRAGVESAGVQGVSTLLATGNLICDSDLPAPDLSAIVTGVLATFGVDRAVYLLDPDEVAQAIDAVPFADAVQARPGHLLLHVTARATVTPDWPGPERILAAGRLVWIDYVAGVGRSKLTGARLTRLVGPGTARNWNTLQKLRQATKGH